MVVRRLSWRAEMRKNSRVSGPRRRPQAAVFVGNRGHRLKEIRSHLPCGNNGVLKIGGVLLACVRSVISFMRPMAAKTYKASAGFFALSINNKASVASGSASSRRLSVAHLPANIGWRAKTLAAAAQYFAVIRRMGDAAFHSSYSNAVSSS